MMNFNTNQVRQLYVAKAYKSSAATVSGGIDNYDPCDIHVGTVDAGYSSGEKGRDKKVFFEYKNADGILTRSDLIDVAKIEYANYTAPGRLATVLRQHTITLNSAVGSFGSTELDLIGHDIFMNIRLRGFIDDDPNSSKTINVGMFVNATNSASAALFYSNLAVAIAKAMPANEKFPPFYVYMSKTTGSPTATTTYIKVSADTDVATLAATVGLNAGVILVEAPQKWVRGKMSNAPIPLEISFVPNEDFVDGMTAWGIDTPADSAVSDSGNKVYTTLSGDFKLADLEYFCLGERGDVARGANWPLEYNPTYAISPVLGTNTYGLLTIQYFENGDGTDVQKSPKTIQIAGSATVLAGSDNVVDAFEAATGLTVKSYT